MKYSEKLIRDTLFDLNRRVNSARSFEEKQLYGSYIYALICGITNSGMNIDLPDSLLKKAIIYGDTIDDNYQRQMRQSYRDNIYFFKDFAKLSDATIDYYLEDSYKYREKISFKDAVDLVKGFLACYDKDIYKHFDELVDNGLVDLFLPNTEDAKEFDGFTYPTLGRESLSITIDKGNIETSTTILHEEIHSFLLLDDVGITYEQDIRKNVNGIDEAYSRFIEIVFMKYLLDIGFNRADISSYMKNYNSTLSEFLFCFDDIIRDKEKRIFGDGMGWYCNAKEYSLGTVLAYHYFDKFLDYPYIVKDDLLRLNHETKYRDFSDLMDISGLDKKDIVNPKKLVKRMDDFNY